VWDRRGGPAKTKSSPKQQIGIKTGPPDAAKNRSIGHRTGKKGGEAVVFWLLGLDSPLKKEGRTELRPGIEPRRGP